MIVVIDYDGGNIKSVTNVLKRSEIDFEISNDSKVIEKSKKIILPGVSNFSHCMESLEIKDLINVLKFEVLEKKKPFLGICSGMQILGTFSEEGHTKGLNFIEGDILKLPKNKCHLIPHVGWNKVNIEENNLTKNIKNNSRFYFCHSYYFKLKDENNSIMKTNYGLKICCGIKKNNIYGIQFHPEKSLEFGKKILKNFATYCN